MRVCVRVGVCVSLRVWGGVGVDVCVWMSVWVYQRYRQTNEFSFLRIKSLLFKDTTVTLQKDCAVAVVHRILLLKIIAISRKQEIKKLFGPCITVYKF